MRLDKNKTHDPRAWALRAGTAEARRPYRKHQRPNAEPHELVFVIPPAGGADAPHDPLLFGHWASAFGAELALAAGARE